MTDTWKKISDDIDKRAFKYWLATVIAGTTICILLALIISGVI